MSTSSSEAIRMTAPTFKADGAAINAVHLEKLSAVRIERGFCTVSRATLRFADNGFVISSSGAFTIGTGITITDPASGQVIFNGEVTSVSLEQTPTYVPELVVTADDQVHRLGRTSVTKTYLKMKSSDVITKLAKAAGLQTDVTATTISFDYLIQGSTALAYVDQLAARAGLVWWCDYPRKLKVAKPDADKATTVDFDLADHKTGMRSFAVRASARNISSVTVTGWDLKQTKKIESSVTTDRTKESDFVDLADAKSTFGASKLTRSDLAPLTEAEAQTLATALNQDVSSQAVTARGSGPGNGKIKPGVSVVVKNAGPASGTYLVTEVEHRYDRTGFTTSFVAGSFRRDGLVDLLSTPAAEPGFTLDNVITAIVTNIADPDKLGRIKVKFPSIPEEPESEWARVVTMGGGSSRGALFLPEVDDEVLVAFERGDTRRPIILGGLYSSKNAFPGDNPVASGKVEVRRLTSRAGHLVELSDKAGDEYVLVQHGTREHQLKFSKDGVQLEAQSGAPLKVTNGQATIEMTDKGDITIEGNKITIKGQMDVAIEGLTVKAKGQTGVNVEAGTQLALKGGAAAELSGGGKVDIKGGKVGING